MSSYHYHDQTLAQLPNPSAGEVAHSSMLIEYIVDKIKRQNGVIAFSEYMNHLLYAPGLGYYAAGLSKFGKQGDFVTAPEISPLFGQSLATQCQQIFDQGCAPRILEFGAGSGKLCLHILEHLNQPLDYYILDISADLRQRQQEFLKENLSFEYFDRITWLERLPISFDGIVIGNELLDAMPVSMLQKTEKWRELGVGFDGERFSWHDYAEDGEAVKQIQTIDDSLGPLPEGYRTEVNLNYRPWFQALSDVSHHVVVLLIDYGYQQAEYYRADRERGTLLCHYHHRAHDDVFILPGLQDVTASVDFDAVASAAAASGFNIIGVAQQGHFLMQNDLLMHASKDHPEGDTFAQLDLASQIKTLTLPDEMGEKFKVIGLVKNLELEIPALQSSGCYEWIPNS
ncbi:MAG: SAM-dependent methyltransferase [Gammaproteobacteria bacterium]|nr:SAM-dependent methyltransferase [Gammaproteobacteria bacterium]